MIGGVSVLSIESQSSAARLGGEVSLSFSRFCSFFGSWSRRTFSHLSGVHTLRCGRKDMPSTRSQVDVEAGEGDLEVAELLEDVAEELSAESAAHKSIEECWSGSGWWRHSSWLRWTRRSNGLVER